MIDEELCHLEGFLYVSALGYQLCLEAAKEVIFDQTLYPWDILINSDYAQLWKV